MGGPHRRVGSLPTAVLMAFWILATSILWVVTWIIFPLHFNGFWSPKAIAWLLGSWMLTCWGWGHPQRMSTVRNPWIRWLTFYLLLFLIIRTFLPQLLLPRTLEPSIPIPWHVAPILPTLIAIGSIGAMLALVHHTTSLKQWEWMASMICIVAGVLAGYGLLQWLRLDQFFHMTTKQYVIRVNSPMTVLGNPMLTANYLAICAPLCLMFRSRWYHLAYLLMVGVIFLVDSTVSQVAVGLSTLGFFLLRRQWRTVGLLLLLGGVALYWKYSTGTLLAWTSDSGRLAAWAKIWELWSSSKFLTGPITGLGLGMVETLASNQWWHWGSLHCEPYQILVETGVVGLVLSLGMLGHLGWRLLRVRWTTLLTGWTMAGFSFLLVSLASFPMRIGSLLMLGVFIWACLEAHTEEGQAYG